MSPRPQFFLIRPGLEQITAAGEVLVEPGTLVPLIPVDLLPGWLDIVDVPRELAPEQTAGMVNLGPVHAETEMYKMRFPLAEGDDSQCAAKEDAVLRILEASNEMPEHLPKHVKGTTPETTRKPTRGLSSSCYNTSITPTSPPPKARTGFCRQWCQRGVCSRGFACRYQHAMPTTDRDLTGVGLSDVPGWFLQAKGETAMPTRCKARRKKAKKERKRMGAGSEVEDGKSERSEEYLIEV